MIILSDLVRDKVNVQKSMDIVGDELIAKQALRIAIPYRYFNRKLAVLGEMITSVIIFAVIVENKWDLMMLPTMMNLTPDETTMESLDGEDYMVLSFDKGSVISPNVNLVRVDQVAYDIYDGFYGSGYKPWFIDYHDYGKLLALSQRYADIKLGPNNIPLELTVAQTAKVANDRALSYRHSLSRGYTTGLSKEPFIAPLQSVLFGANNLSTQLVGAYLRDGILTAMTYPSTKSEPAEELLRS